ncbi:predicted protein [Histoplasma capsulatum var. duboisii H88]|uniref:Predicted protein n=1 Tax=Ajellomyces capsulatus (strain H88) TaxID=544711 RepID=F0UVF2_AJEC8|nr:predicted protein [Histoplasma capsulatum var. duboisii H88]
MSYKCFAGSFYSFLSVLCQRQVCSACMFSIQRPFSLAVTDDEAARVGGHLLCGSSGLLRAQQAWRVYKRLDGREVDGATSAIPIQYVDIYSFTAFHFEERILDSIDRATALSPKARRIILTTGVTICTIMGSLYGAGLKMDQDAKKEAERQRSATTAEKIHALEAAREVLVRRRTSLEKQINDLRTRQENRRRNENIGDSGRPR